MPDKQLQELIAATGEILDLDESVIEKDYYVTQVIQTLSTVENLPINTIIEDTLENITLFTPTLTHCVSVNETAIEKWVGLTRRIVAIERAYHPDDETLIRHVYDLNAIKQAQKINEDFFILAKTIVSNDAKQFKNQHPEYAADPSAEIKLSLALLKNKPVWEARYQKFIEEMVYDSGPALEYENAITAIGSMSRDIIDSLPQEDQK